MCQARYAPRLASPSGGDAIPLASSEQWAGRPIFTSGRDHVFPLENRPGRRAHRLLIILCPSERYVSDSTRAIVFNAIPLLLVAATYLAVAASLAPTLWHERARTTLVDLVPALTFPAYAIAALIWGIVTLIDGRPLAGHVWASLVGLVLALVPPVLVALRWRERRLLAAGPLLARVAEERRSLRDRELEASSRLSNALARTERVDDVARAFLREVLDLFRVGFAGLALVSDDGREARGLLAIRAGKEWAWWQEMVVDLEREPSGIASAVYEASPLGVYDLASSPRISARLAEAVGAKSAAFVPLVAGEQVIAVLSIATLDELRAFSGEELSLLQALASEAATALDRARSATALSQALERERLVASIGRRLRSHLDLDAILRVAVEDTARALGVARCFVRVGALGEDMPVAAEWREPGLRPIVEVTSSLPVSNVAARDRRTVTIANVEDAEELADPTLGSREALVQLGTRAALATPIVVGDRLIGVFAVHRTHPGEWFANDVLLVESVAHEVGLALHVTRLLEENRDRIERQSALLRAAQVLTGELELGTVLERLVDQLADLIGADAADCYLYDSARGVLRCAAVRGLPDDLVGFEFPLGKGLATPAIADGRPVISADYDQLGEPVPHEAYQEFSTAAIAPMRWNDEVQGVLGVGRRGDRPFDRADGEALEVFAGLASLALQNAETFAQSSRQARVQRGFYRIASVLGQSLSRQATLAAVAQAATEALGGKFGAVLMPNAGRLELAGAHELPSSLSQFFEGGAPETGALAKAAAEQRVLAAPLVLEDDRFTPEWRTLAAEIPYASLLSVPVEVPRRAGGGLVLVFFKAPRFFTDDDLDLARHLADAARGALERSDLYEAERSSRTLAQQLARTGSLLATELDPAAVLDEVVQEAPSLLRADACAIRVLEGDELVVSAAEGPGAREAVGARSAADTGPSGDVIQTRSPVTADASQDELRLRERDPMLAAGHSCYLGVPLVGPEGALHGVLAVYARGPREWRPEEVEALRALAANTSAALSNAELYQRVALEKERSFAILANIADGIVAIDRDARVVLWNAAAERITGIPAEEALGRTTAEALQRTLESEGETIAGDRLVSIQRDGDEVWLSLTEAVMRDPAGVVAGRIFAFRDISTDRLVEQMKSDFVSAVSHELRTPLTSIYGFAETLLREDVRFGEEERRIFLGYIASESQRLTSIVDALLNVARLDTGDLQVSLAPTDVGAVVSEVVADADSDGHEFVLDLPDEPLAAEADREKLRQVFTILVDNAIKYSPAGARVLVGGARKTETVEIRVVDEGPGIPQSEQERIFRKFYRGDAAGRLGAAGGTGLGLFIAQGLVAAMGGRIWVTSNESRGSSFGVELPLATDQLRGRETAARRA